MRRYYERERPFELRPVEYAHYIGKKPAGDRFNVWFKTTAKLPDDPAIHQCALAYASDFTLLDSSLVPLGRTPLFDKEGIDGREPRSGALWLYRPFRALMRWLALSPAGISSRVCTAIFARSLRED